MLSEKLDNMSIALSEVLDNTSSVRSCGHRKGHHMEGIKQHINDYVDDHDTTREALAKAIGISRSSLYDKMSGKRPWMLDEVIRLADYMGCTVQDLITAAPGVVA